MNLNDPKRVYGIQDVFLILRQRIMLNVVTRNQDGRCHCSKHFLDVLFLHVVCFLLSTMLNNWMFRTTLYPWSKCLFAPVSKIREWVSFEPPHEKPCLMLCTNNKGADKPAHPRSLISAFDGRCLDGILITVLAKSKNWRLVIFYRWAGRFESYLVGNPRGRFFCDMAHLFWVATLSTSLSASTTNWAGSWDYGTFRPP